MILKNGTSDSRKDRFMVGDYKKMPNEVGGMDICLTAQDRYKVYLDYFRIEY